MTRGTIILDRKCEMKCHNCINHYISNIYLTDYYCEKKKEIFNDFEEEKIARKCEDFKSIPEELK